MPIQKLVLAVVIATTLPSLGCGRKSLPQWDAAEPLDVLLEEVEAAPDEVSALLRYAAMVEGYLRADASGALELDHQARAEDAVTRLQSCATRLPREAGRCEAAMGRLLVALGREQSGENALVSSLARHQTLEGLDPLLDLMVAQERDGDELTAVCARERAWLSFQGNVVALLDACQAHGVALDTFASAEDRESWRKLDQTRRYQRSFAHEVRWADPERLKEAYGVELEAPSPTPESAGSEATETP